MYNDYSHVWFTLFLSAVPEEQTEAETAFLMRHLPRPAYKSIADLCCGTGRHARLLAAHGYGVTGVDRDAGALAEAKKLSNAVSYVLKDMRQFATIPGTFDGVLNLWQSFGYFDEVTNREVLAQIGEKLRLRGRLILDVYHRGFFEAHLGTRHFERNDVAITEIKTMRGNRLTVRLEYDGAASDAFDWQLYTPKELIDLASAYGFSCLVACTGFDEARPPVPTEPRMQFVFEKE